MATKSKAAPAKKEKAVKVENPKPKAAAKPKEDKFETILNEVLIKLKKDPLTRRDMINLIQQRLNKAKK
jgi:hypothetical protein